MAGRIKVDEITPQSGAGTVSFPNGGANFGGNVDVNGTVTADAVNAAIALKNFTDNNRPSTGNTTGTLIWNTTQLEVQVWDGTDWVRLRNPYTTINATSIEGFWDGASDQITGSVWKSKFSHPNVTNANVTMINNPTYSPTVPGGDGSIGYWSFNGTSHYGWINDLNYGSSGSHGPQNNGRLYEFVQLAWFRTSYGSANTGGSYDFNNWSWYDWDRSEVIGWNIGSHGKLQFAGRSNVTCCYDIVSDTPCNDGQWHMGVAVISASNGYIKFYLDGQPDGTRNYSFSYFGSGSRRWGFVGDGSEASGNNGGRNSIYYDGDIAQLALLSEFWDDAKVLEHYNKTKTRFGK